MKTLIVYYSRDGSTRKLSEAMKPLLDADIEEISEPSGRGGPLGWLRSGKEATKGMIVPINPVKLDPAGYDVVVIGTPIWAWNVSSPVRSYIVAAEGKLPKVAFFCCMDGNPGETFKVMEVLAGKAPVATMEIMGGDVKKSAYTDKLKSFVDKISAS